MRTAGAVQRRRAAERVRYGVILGALVALAAACGGDNPTDVTKQTGMTPPRPVFLENTAFNSADECMGDDAKTLPFNDPGSLVSGFKENSDPNSFVCNAKEVFIASATVTQVFDPEANGGVGEFVPYDAANPPQCVEGQDITFKMVALLQQHANSERGDIGVWIATDGGNAKTGECNQYNLPKNAPGTFNGDGDQCAGLLSEGDQASIDLGELTVPCNPDPVTNKLSVGSCIGWKVPSDGDDASCADNKDGVAPDGTPDDFRAGTLPVNKTKCNCEPFLLDIVVVKKATIEVRKQCVPTNDNGTFDLEINDVVKKNDATCAGGAASTTGAVEVGAGTSADPGADHTVAESGFTFANYTSTVSCTKNAEAYIASQAYTPDNNLDVHVEPDDAIVCTFVNTRKANIEIEKVTQPSPDGPNTDFGFGSPGLSPTTFTLKNGGIRTFSNVTPNTTTGYAVTEDDPTPGYDLISISCTNPDGQNASTTTLASRLATVRVNPGETVRCTFTNRKRASVTIKKVTVPAEVPAVGSFTFSNPFDATGSFNLGHDGTKTFNNVEVGVQKQVTESDPTPGYDLTNISCTGAATWSGNLATRTVSVTPATAEVITCTFTNRKRGTVIIEKQTDPDGATGTFTFVQNVDANGNFNLTDGQTKTFNNVVPGQYTVTESNPNPGFDLTNLVCDDANSTESVANRAATINVEAGETVTCVYTNRQRATVTVNKRENGTLPLSRPWAFQVRSGASLAAPGTTVASGTADQTTGVVTLSCVAGQNPPCANDGGVIRLVPGVYQFCEIDMPAGFSNSIPSPPGFTPNGGQPEGADNGDECFDITLTAGENETINIDNILPPGGDARTIGYWKNHSCLAKGNQADVLSPLLPISVGIGYTVNGVPDASDFIIGVGQCSLAVSILDKRSFNNGKKMASDGAYNLASQLVAALLNIKATAGSCDAANNAIADGQKLLDQINFNGSGAYLKSGDALYATAVSLAGTLDLYNNNQLCGP